MTHNYPNTPRNNQGLSYPEQNFSEFQPTDIFPATVEESQQVIIYEQQANLDMQWTEYFTDAVRLIRQSLNQENILETATEEVRRVLGCDRVVIYGLNPESEGVVIAESVAPGFTKAWGLTIKDPCFAARYIEKYENGRVKATDNIYEANLTPCYISQLEKLQVKGNLVAPILTEDKLLGLLVAHQCSQPRHWQDYEIRWFSQIAMQVGFALDNAKILAETANLRQQIDRETAWTQYLTDTVKLIRQSLTQEDILETATEEVRRVLGCDRVVVYGLNPESEGVVIAESVAPGFTPAWGLTIKDPCFAARYTQKYENGRVRATDNIYEAGLTLCYINQLEKLQVKANLVAPILTEDKLLGLLVAHQCSQPHNWQDYEIRWFSQIAMQVGFALDNAKILAETANLRQQAHRETTWTQHFTDTVKLIRQSLNQEDILETATEEVRRILGCDRVVIYGLNPESEGVVIAESVAPGFTKAWGLTIKDPCFAARYIEKYENGRVKATDNIYEANLTPCYISQLEKLQVKGNLVAPILNEGKLLGLLVAHQCSQPRHWQNYEIRWFSQIAMQVGFALDNAKILAETANLRQQADRETAWTQYFTDTVKLIRQSLTQEDILETATEEVKRVLGCDRVVVYGINPESEGVIIAESVAPRFTKTLGATIKDPCFDAMYLEKYENGRVKATDNIYTANFTPCYIEQLEKLQVQANLVAPILNEGKLLGLLVAHQCSQPRHWQEYEIRWFSQVAMHVGFALDNATVLAETANLRRQVDTEAEWMHYFTQTVRLIRQSLNQEDILQTTVKEVRRIFGCDRVVVYSLSENSQGVVTAESAAPYFTKALGATIEDPCFDAMYIEKYENGRVKATDNIYEANLTPCYIEQLEKLEVKANLVAPILHQGKLLGLLVAHQCSQPRHWQEYEIRWFSQVAMHIGFALDNAKIIEHNAQANQSISLSQRISLSQQEELKKVVVELLQDNQILFKAFSAKTLNLSDSLAACLKNIQEVFDAAKAMTITVEQVEQQVQQNYHLLEQGRENIKSTLASISVLQETVTNGGIRLQQFNQNCQQLSRLIDHFTVYLTKPIENGNEESVIINTEEVYRLRQQLFAVISEIQPLLTSAIARIDEMAEIIEPGGQQTSAWTQSLQTAEKNLDCIVAVNMQMDKLVDNMNQIATNQAQVSDQAGQYVMSASKIVNQMLGQSQSLTKWFTQLAIFAQENIQKIMFWENIKGFLRSSRTLVTFFRPKN